MATIKTPFILEGNLGNLSTYTRYGSDKVIVRRKGRASKERIMNDPSFDLTRKNNTEFSACTKLTQGIRRALFPLRHLGDPNFTGRLNKLAKKIQKTDTSHRGQRGVSLSGNKHLLQGFLLNQIQPFDGIVRYPVSVQANREEASAVITIPELITGINLHLIKEAPYYRFRIILGMVSDVTFSGGEHELTGTVPFVVHNTGWQHVQKRAGEINVTMELPIGLPDEASYVLGIGIEQGVPDGHGDMGIVERAGSAKVLAVF